MLAEVVGLPLQKFTSLRRFRELRVDVLVLARQRLYVLCELLALLRLDLNNLRRLLELLSVGLELLPQPRQLLLTLE